MINVYDFFISLFVALTPSRFSEASNASDDEPPALPPRRAIARIDQRVTPAAASNWSAPAPKSTAATHVASG